MDVGQIGISIKDMEGLEAEQARKDANESGSLLMTLGVGDTVLWRGRPHADQEEAWSRMSTLGRGPAPHALLSQALETPAQPFQGNEKGIEPRQEK